MRRRAPSDQNRGGEPLRQCDPVLRGSVLAIRGPYGTRGSSAVGAIGGCRGRGKSPTRGLLRTNHYRYLQDCPVQGLDPGRMTRAGLLLGAAGLSHLLEWPRAGGILAAAPQGDGEAVAVRARQASAPR